ncbi:MAG: plasmid replication protein, CyRepA1 family, partial [Cyanobacteria bacterium P01_H01_bin.21]
IAMDEQECLESLLIGAVKRTNTGQVSSSILKQYQHLKDGGVWFPGWSVKHGYSEPWGVLKPITAKPDKSGKLRKYETPPKWPWLDIPVFLPQPTPALEKRIRARQGNLNPHLPWDEWLMASDTPLAVVEGAKKAMAVLAQGLPCIGIYSMWAFSDKHYDGNKAVKTLKPEFKPFAESRKEIYFIADNDTGDKQRRLCELAVMSLSQLLGELDCDLKVIDYAADYCEKGIDDAIAAAENLGESGYSILCSLVKKSQDSVSWLQYRKANRRHFKPDYYLNEKYLSWPSIQQELTETERIVGIKSAKGTGKTEVITKLVAENKAKRKQTILITHRESLSRANGRRCGLPYWRDSRRELLRYGFALCIDSVRKFSEFGFYPEVYTGQDVVIDEIDQVIKHLLESSTCREHRVQIFEDFKKLLQVCDRLFVLDADLSANSLQLLEDLSGKKSMVFENRWMGNGYPIEIDSSSNPYNLVGDALQQAANGSKLLILCDSMKAKSKYGTTCLESLFKAKFPDLRVLRIDSSSLADPYSDAYGCLSGLNTNLQKYDVVIASPSIGTGVSIDLRGHFDCCYAILWGVLSPSGNRQFLARLRDTSVPRKVWTARMGLSGYGNGSDRPEILAAVNTRKFNATLRRLGMSNVWETDGDRLCSEYTAAFYRIAALRNYERYHYRELFRSGLQLEGCEISGFIYSHQYEKRELLDLIAENREVVYCSARQREIEAEDISEKQFKQLEKADTLDLDEQAKLSRFKRKSKYCIDVTDELIEADDKGLYGRLRLLYLMRLTQKSDVVDKEKLDKKKEGTVFLPDIGRGLFKLRISLFEHLGLGHFLVDSENDADIYSNDDELVQKVAKCCRDNYQSIRNIFNTKIDLGGSDIRIISHMLKRCVGVGLRYESLSKGSGYRPRRYASALIPALYHDIMAAWRKRDEEKDKQPAEPKASSSEPGEGDRHVPEFVQLDFIRQREVSIYTHS